MWKVSCGSEYNGVVELCLANTTYIVMYNGKSVGEYDSYRSAYDKWESMQRCTSRDKILEDMMY